MRKSLIGLLAALGMAAATLAACGGGSGQTGSGGSTAGPGLSGASAGALSSGAITAFGSVFVNGREFATGSARVVDDDAGTSSTDTSALEVGMSVDVKAASSSRSSRPEAAEIHLHPLARGVVDAIDATASTIKLMGQTVQLTASTVVSDHRACVGAAASPCTAATGLTDLSATTGSGTSLLPGSYLTVHGFLFDPGSGAGIVATLLVVDDAPAPTAAAVASYKVEGPVSAVGSGADAGTVTIAGLVVDLNAATCRGSGAASPCGYSVGQIVSAVAATAPALPATRFSASQARRVGRIAVETPGATVELEGRVASVDATTRHLVLRGIDVDASAITDLVLPVVGDGVRVLGTVAADGRGVVASIVSVVHPARSTIYGFEGDAGDVVAGTAANTWTLSLLGQSLQIDADTRLVDLTLTRGRHGHGAGAASANPFNITSFQTYLAASPSKHLVVRSRDAGNGSLRALSVAIVPASSGAAVAGLVDASPAPVLSSGPGVPTTFSVHGVAVSADQAALLMRRLSLAGTQLAAGDYVLARGTLVAGTAGGAATLVVAAPANGGLRPDGRNVVVDFGPLSDRDRDRDCF